MSIVEFAPLASRCLIQRIMPHIVTKSGIYLTQSAVEKQARLGKVISVGKGETNDNGNFMKTSVKPGDIVLLPEFAGTKVEMADTKNEYLLYRDSELLGIVGQYKH